mmetsp:Transcript_33038/g.87326  ORF Transcript_33038/g.87326 Transcript_33038/m.87326 type:complete len:285 (+) Transcript_33038:498-1352(+)
MVLGGDVEHLLHVFVHARQEGVQRRVQEAEPDYSQDGVGRQRRWLQPEGDHCADLGRKGQDVHGRCRDTRWREPGGAPSVPQRHGCRRRRRYGQGHVGLLGRREVLGHREGHGGRRQPQGQEARPRSQRLRPDHGRREPVLHHGGEGGPGAASAAERVGAPRPPVGVRGATIPPLSLSYRIVGRRQRSHLYQQSSLDPQRTTRMRWNARRPRRPGAGLAGRGGCCAARTRVARTSLLASSGGLPGCCASSPHCPVGWSAIAPVRVYDYIDFLERRCQGACDLDP